MDTIPTIWPFMVAEAMPEGSVGAIHLLLTLHTALTVLAFAAGPMLAWEAWRDRAGLRYWFFAALPLVVEGQRLLVGNRCIVQDLAKELWRIDDERWAPDLYGIHASNMTYVVDACIASYAAGLIVSVGLFLRRRRNLFVSTEPQG